MNDRNLERRYDGSRALAGLLAGGVAGLAAGALTYDVITRSAGQRGAPGPLLFDVSAWVGRLPVLVDLSRLLAQVRLPDVQAGEAALAVGAVVTGIVTWVWFAEWAAERRAARRAEALAPPVHARDRDEARRLARRPSYARKPAAKR